MFPRSYVVHPVGPSDPRPCPGGSGLDRPGAVPAPEPAAGGAEKGDGPPLRRPDVSIGRDRSRRALPRNEARVTYARMQTTAATVAVRGMRRSAGAAVIVLFHAAGDRMQYE